MREEKPKEKGKNEVFSKPWSPRESLPLRDPLPHVLSTQGRSRQKNLEFIVPDLNRWYPHTSRKEGGIEDHGAGSCFNPTSQQISYNSNRYRSNLHLLILICVCMGSCENKIFLKKFKT